MDITKGWEEEGLTKIYLHPGYKLAKQKWPSVIVGQTPSVEDAVFFDINNNGRVDVISSTEGRNKKVYVNWAPDNPDDYLDSSKWKTEILPASDGLMQWMFAHPAQIDSKHGTDLIVGSKGHEAKIGWFQAPEDLNNLSHWNWYPINPAGWVISLLLRGIDEDGDMDIVASDRKPGETNGVRWLENPRKATNQRQLWDSHLMGGRGLDVTFLDMFDMDGDGLEDIIVPEATN